MRTMKEVVEQYNKLTGKNVKRFATVAHGEKAIAKLNAAPAAPKKTKAKPKPKPDSEYKMRISVDGVEHRSVATAFRDLKLPIGAHIRFRGKLKEHSTAVFKHGDKEYNFKLLD